MVVDPSRNRFVRFAPSALRSPQFGPFRDR